MRHDLRAQVVIDPPIVALLPDGRKSIQLSARNTGKTKATVAQQPRMDICKSKDFNYDEDWKAIESVANFTDDYITFEETIEPDTSMEFGVISQGIPEKDPYYVYGYVVYRDVFQSKTTVRRCYQFDPGTGKFRSVGRYDITKKLKDAIEKSHPHIRFPDSEPGAINE
jgi:hypothetical protein